MIDSQMAAYIGGTILAIVICMLAGDYLGYKVGRMKLFTTLGVLSLAVVVIFAIVAAINALTTK